MTESKIIKRRTVLVPLLQGLVWLASISVSIFYDFGGSFPDGSVTRRLLTFGIISLFFELLFVVIDMLFALSGYRISRSLSFHIQMRTFPFVIFGIPFAVMAYISTNWIDIVVLFICLAGLKSGLLQAIVEIDKDKVPQFDVLSGS
ncbi:MAG: hypothetical protein HDS38_04540 [Bacteroides sp.]|nr:hypothetical protein [Bacteroides sp.]